MTQPSKKVILKNLRNLFYYDANGKPLLTSYGVFKQGVTESEVNDYLAVRLNTFNIKKTLKKLENMLCGSTCPVALFNGKEVILYYRHDIERFADAVIDKIPTYFD